MTQVNYEELDLPEITLDRLVVGAHLGTIEHIFTPQDVADYVNLRKDVTRWFDPHTDGNRRVHPIQLGNEYYYLLHLHFHTPGMILIETEHQYKRPLWTGELLRTFGKVSDKGLLNGREFVEVETWTADEKGEEVARMLSKALLSMEKKSDD